MALAKELVQGGFSAGQAKAISGGTATVAAAGTSQGTGTPITTSLNIVTGASGTNAVVLPSCQVGDSVLIYSSAATNALLVFPDSGSSINALSANASYSLPAQKSCQLVRISATQWVTDTSA